MMKISSWICVREAAIIKKLLQDSDKINVNINIFCMASNKNPQIINDSR